MSGKREEVSDRSRKLDKKSSDTHREFLDMDTDEEDFGRQETPEIEEELPPEPEKPVYDEEDLALLVRYVKNLVVLPSLKEEDWNESCYEIIREYFRNPSHTILSIFYADDALTAMLQLPRDTYKGFTYFLRSSWQIFTTENFLDTVTFGTVNENISNSVLKLMDTLYAPIGLNSDDWPQIITNELFLNLHNFVICLSEKVYKPVGLTMLYVPKERIVKEFFATNCETDLSFARREACEEAVGRLEKVVWCWIKLIREDVKASLTRKNINSVADELHYWHARHSNLCILHAQFANKDLRSIVQVLRHFRSASVESFVELIVQVEEQLKQASSNIMYLQILSESCANLNVSDHANESITNALLLILFIWNESPYYNATNDIGTLCQMLSTQIIDGFREQIRLDLVFGKDPESGIDIIEKCLNFCDIYKTIYDKLTLNVAPLINSEKQWNVNEDTVFSSINIFKSRCLDVVDICKTLIVFGRCNKIGLLGTPRGKEYEMYCQRIENLLYESLQEIEAASDIIFDVRNSLWLTKICEFKRSVVDLENVVKNLIDDMFENVATVEEGVEALYSLQNFRQSENLKDLLESKWIQVWKIFLNEVKQCHTTTIVEAQGSPSYTNDAATNLLCVMKYLKAQHTTMMNAVDWMGDCVAQRSILEQYKCIVDAIDDKINTLQTDTEYRRTSLSIS